ncbi:MAG: 30S ribosomal protein S8 [Patescibacteria group bacterium]|nr:30S ribosomal protein S8 [Patescibacteria group bacterium]
MYTDLLVKIKNAQAVKKESVKSSYSVMDNAILEILSKKNFIDEVSVKGRAPKKVLDVNLKYDKNGLGAIHGVKILSKPSRHLYTSYSDIYPVKQGFGALVVSTSKGIMEGQSAKKAKLGGELLFEIW